MAFPSPFLYSPITLKDEEPAPTKATIAPKTTGTVQAAQTEDILSTTPNTNGIHMKRTTAVPSRALFVGGGGRSVAFAWTACAQHINGVWQKLSPSPLVLVFSPQ